MLLIDKKHCLGRSLNPPSVDLVKNVKAVAIFINILRFIEPFNL
jgi:hypothetical protein